MTHAATAARFRQAVAAIDDLQSLNAPAVHYPVGD
jgi:hypothetical protein